MTKKQDKPFRPKARRPRGFEDKPAGVLQAERALVRQASEVYERWGFEPLDTPAFEYADALGKFLPDEERPNEGVFALQDDDEQWMALRYDLTAPLARYVAENFDALPKPFRRYAFGPVWRNEKPGPGRFREFIQCDADTVGAPGPAADAEMIAIAAEIMEAAGLRRGEYLIRVSDRRILDSLLADIGLPNTTAGQVAKARVLRAIDKLDRLGPEAVSQLLGPGRRDESGDFTEGAGLSTEGINRIGEFVSATARLAGLLGATGTGDETNASVLGGLRAELEDVPGSEEALASLREINSTLDALGLGPDRWRIDTSVIRGLGYYTGPVYEAELLLEVTNDDGQRVRVGSVGGGGRYDDLVARFRGQETPATGFSFGVSRFAAALTLAGRTAGADEKDLVVVLALEPEQMGDYFALARELRAAGVRAEVYLGGGKNMGKQLKYADRRGAAVAVLIGPDERLAGKVTVKDLAKGAELSKDIATREEWTATRAAQETINRDRLISWVKSTLKKR
jgi:histidyl-tRNA synthetase